MCAHISKLVCGPLMGYNTFVLIVDTNELGA